VFKTPARNNLSAASLEACILSEQFFGSKEFEVLPEMYEKYTTLLVKKKVNLVKKTSSDIEIQCELPSESHNVESSQPPPPDQSLQAIKILKQLLRLSPEEDVVDSSSLYQTLPESLKRFAMSQSSGIKIVKLEENHPAPQNNRNNDPAKPDDFSYQSESERFTEEKALEGEENEEEDQGTQ